MGRGAGGEERGRQAGEHILPIAPIEELLRRHEQVESRWREILSCRLADPDQTIRMSVGKGSKNDRVDDAEHCDRGADGDGKCGQDDRCEAGIAAQQPGAVKGVSDEVVEPIASSVRHVGHLVRRDRSARRTIVIGSRPAG